MSIQNVNIPPTEHILMPDNAGWIGLIDHMGNESSIVNAARVSFGKKKTEMDNKDVVLLNYLYDNEHMSPFESVTFTFSIHCPLFIRSQIMRHRTFAFSEISRRYTDEDITFFNPKHLRIQSDSNRQASKEGSEVKFNDDMIRIVEEHNSNSLKVYNNLLEHGVCRELARGVLSQNMMTTFLMTGNLRNFIHFLHLRDSDHAQYESKCLAKGMKTLLKPYIPNLSSHLGWL